MKVLVSDATMIQRLDDLKAMVGAGVQWQVCNGSEEQQLELLLDTNIFIGSPFTREMAQAATSLQLIQLAGAGTGGVDFSSLPQTITVANTYNHERSIAEYVLMCMLALTRRLLVADRELRRGNWYAVRHDSTIPMPETMEGQTVGIIGFGHIGQQVARLSRLLGMNVIAIKSRPDAQLKREFGLDFLGSQDDLPRLLHESDFLVVAVPLTSDTRNLINAQALAAMRSGAFLINVARGAVVNEEALYNALATGQIAGAAIDTWYNYPGQDGRAMPSALPFHQLDNVIMTPHTSGETAQTNTARARDIASNIQRMLAGEPLRNVVFP